MTGRVLGIVLALCCAGPLSHAEARLAPDSSAQYDVITVVPDQQTRVVTLAFRFPDGSAQDPRGLEGTAFLLGRVLEDVGNEQLLPYGARVSITVAPHEWLVILSAAPNRWQEAARVLESVLYRDALSSAVLASHQTQMTEVLVFETGSPVREFELERAELLFGPGHLAARPVQGTHSGIGALTVQDLTDFRSAYLQRPQAIVAALGPVDPVDVGAVLSAPVRVAGFDLNDRDPLRGSRGLEPPFRVPPPSGGLLAWNAEEQHVQDRQLTATWMTVAFPFQPDTPELLLSFLEHLVEERLNPSPPDPGLYEMQVAVERVRDAPVLVISASVDPRIAARWKTRLESSLADLADAPPTGSFFELSRRRFRSALLMDLADPEARVRRLVRHVARHGNVEPDLERELWRLDEAGVTEAARSAGPHRILLFGPAFLMEL